MARLVIHIGTHKTGTTYVQSMISANAARLAHQGVHVPRFDHRAGHHPLAAVWNARFRRASVPSDRAWRRLRSFAAATSGTVLVSSEELSRLYGPARVRFAEMRALADAFDEVRVVCVLRNQASFLQSAYQQVSRHGIAPGWRNCLKTALEKQRFSGLTLNYDRLYSRLLDGFNRHEIHLISYEAACSTTGGLIGALLDAAGWGSGPHGLRNVADAKSNRSPEPLSTYLYNRAKLRGGNTCSLAGIEARLKVEHGRDCRTTLFTRSELRRLGAVFEPSNTALENRVAPIQPGFRIAPILPGAATVWREDILPALWA